MICVEVGCITLCPTLGADSLVSDVDRMPLLVGETPNGILRNEIWHAKKNCLAQHVIPVSKVLNAVRSRSIRVSCKARVLVLFALLLVLDPAQLER